MYLNYLTSSVGIFLVVGDCAYDSQRSYHPRFSGRRQQTSQESTSADRKPGSHAQSILIGNNLVNISATSLATTLAIDVFGSAGAGIATGVLTILVLIFGEITPKTYATIKNTNLALRFGPVIYYVTKVLTPVVIVINKLSTGLLMLLRIDAKQSKRS